MIGSCSVSSSTLFHHVRRGLRLSQETLAVSNDVRRSRRRNGMNCLQDLVQDSMISAELTNRITVLREVGEKEV